MGLRRARKELLDIEEYINEEDRIFISTKLLEMAPDLFTSIGILGTIRGLVWGPQKIFSRRTTKQ